MPRTSKKTSGKKRKSPSGSSVQRLKQIKVPPRIQRKIDKAIDIILAPLLSDSNEDDSNKEKKEPSPQILTSSSVENRLHCQLKLVHLDVPALEECLVALQQDHEQGSRQLVHFCASSWNQQQLAIQVFHFLDHAGKGVVVLEDLQRVADEYLADEEGEPDEWLAEMISMVDQSGDGLLSQDDFVRIARRIHLRQV